MEVRFRGGGKAQAYLEKLEGRVNRASRAQVGFVNDATYPDGTPVAQVAAMNNFGTPTQPPRPFMSNAIREHKAEWGKDMALAMMAGDHDAVAALTVVAERMEEDIRQAIRDTDSPPNAASTIQKKGSNKPLYDTGFMLDNVGSRIT